MPHTSLTALFRRKTTKISEETTTKERLSAFYVLLFGVTLITVLFTFLIHTADSRQYQRVIHKMVLLNELFESNEKALSQIKSFVTTETAPPADIVNQNLDAMESCLTILQDSEQDLRIFRELQDCADMAAAIRARTGPLYRAMELYKDENTSFETVHSDSREIYAISEALSSRYNIISKMQLDNIQKSFQTMQTRTRAFFTVFLIMTGILFFFLLFQIHELARAVSDPVQALTQAAEKIKKGGICQNISVSVSAKVDRDLRILTEVFHDMILQVKRQMEIITENARIAQELERAHLRELQLQINPHFMFNTLNMISDTAYLEHADNTAQLLEQAAKMFRFSLDYAGKKITLYKELEELGRYVTIQEKRFGNRIRFLFELDESFHFVEIPALILQPLVENAIVHGVGMYTENGRITIKTRYEKESGTGWLIVEDNGLGMPEEKRIQVLRDIHSYTDSGLKIGLGNVYQRLRMTFGDLVSVEITSIKEHGTRVAFAIPLPAEVKYPAGINHQTEELI